MFRLNRIPTQHEMSMVFVAHRNFCPARSSGAVWSCLALFEAGDVSVTTSLDLFPPGPDDFPLMLIAYLN